MQRLNAYRRSVVVEVDAGLGGERAQALLHDSAHRTRRHLEPDKAVAFWPPETLGLDVRELSLLGLDVGVRNLVGHVRALSGQQTLASHRILGDAMASKIVIARFFPAKNQSVGPTTANSVKPYAYDAGV